MYVYTSIAAIRVPILYSCTHTLYKIILFTLYTLNNLYIHYTPYTIYYDIESKEKEQALTSFKNIVFAHLDVKLTSAGIDIGRWMCGYKCMFV